MKISELLKEEMATVNGETLVDMLRESFMSGHVRQEPFERFLERFLNDRVSFFDVELRKE